MAGFSNMNAATQATFHLFYLCSSWSYVYDDMQGDLEQRVDARAIKYQSHTRVLTSIHKEVYGDLDRKSSAYHREPCSSIAY